MLKNYIHKLVMRALDKEMADLYSTIETMDETIEVLRSRLNYLMTSDKVVLKQTIDPESWVTVKYFNNVNGTDVSESRLRLIWCKLHHTQEPKKCYINPETNIYPADFIASVVNGRFDHFK